LTFSATRGHRFALRVQLHAKHLDRIHKQIQVHRIRGAVLLVHGLTSAQGIFEKYVEVGFDHVRVLERDFTQFLELAQGQNFLVSASLV